MARPVEKDTAVDSVDWLEPFEPRRPVVEDPSERFVERFAIQVEVDSADSTFGAVVDYAALVAAAAAAAVGDTAAVVVVELARRIAATAAGSEQLGDSTVVEYSAAVAE